MSGSVVTTAPSKRVGTRSSRPRPRAMVPGDSRAPTTSRMAATPTAPPAAIAGRNGTSRRTSTGVTEVATES